jgi:hypothetical protein
LGIGARLGIEGALRFQSGFKFAHSALQIGDLGIHGLSI